MKLEPASINVDKLKVQSQEDDYILTGAFSSIKVFLRPKVNEIKTKLSVS